jgi:hypothetical protein
VCTATLLPLIGDLDDSVAGLFEAFAREQFVQRVTNADQLTAGKGNVFQRLKDVESLFSQHTSIELVDLAVAEQWTRLKVVFAKRHLLTHQQGIVDQRFSERRAQEWLHARSASRRNSVRHRARTGRPPTSHERTRPSLTAPPLAIRTGRRHPSK